MINFLRNYRIRRNSERLAAALAPTPLHEDDPATRSEAEYWDDRAAVMECVI